MSVLLATPHIGGMRIAEKIILAADRRGLSQARVERLSGLPSGRLSKWSKGVGEPTGAQCWRIAETLGIPVAWLLDDRAGGEPPSASDDQTLLRIYHALGISMDEAIRRLSTPAAPPASGFVQGLRTRVVERPANLDPDRDPLEQREG